MYMLVRNSRTKSLWAQDLRAKGAEIASRRPKSDVFMVNAGVGSAKAAFSSEVE
jgi:hypothetical protein